MVARRQRRAAVLLLFSSIHINSTVPLSVLYLYCSSTTTLRTTSSLVKISQNGPIIHMLYLTTVGSTTVPTYFKVHRYVNLVVYYTS